MLRRLIQTDRDLTALIVRLALGIMILPHGAQKLLGWFDGPGFSGAMQFLIHQEATPAPFAFLAIVAEFFGGLGLVTGLLTRVAAFGVGTVMTVAAVKVHLTNGFFMNWFGNQRGEGFEFHLLAVGLALAAIIRGGGALSVDGLLDGRTVRR